MDERSVEVADLKKMAPFWEKLHAFYAHIPSEYTVSNTLFFQKKHRFRVIEYGQGNLYLFGDFYDGGTFLLPTTDDIEILKNGLKLIPGAVLYPIPDGWKEQLDPSGDQSSAHRDDSDYLFQTEEWKELAGRQLSARRNQIHQLEAQMKITKRPLNGTTVQDAQEILKKWQDHFEGSKQDSDYCPVRRSFELLNQLPIFGEIYYGDELPIGFYVAERFGQNTLLMHSVKGVPKLNGIVPYLFRDVARTYHDLEWINIGQDLGIPSLRRGKMAYHPAILLNKWRVQL